MSMSFPAITVHVRHHALAIVIAMALPASVRGQQAAAVIDSCVALGPRLSLATTIARTLANSPAVAGAHGAVRTASAARQVAIGAYLPSLVLSSTGGWSDQAAATTTGVAPATSPTQSAISGGLATLLDVYTGGRRAAQRSQADAIGRAADADLVLQRYATIYVAKQAYLDVLRAHELTRVATDQVTQAGLGLQFAERRERAGTATRADVLSAQLALSAARQQQLAADDTLHTAAAALGRLVGVDGPVDAEPLTTLDAAALPMSDSAVVQLAVASAPAVGITTAQASADTAALRAARTLYVPTVTAGAGYSWSNNRSFPGGARPGWIMTIGTTFPLFDGFVREATITQATVAADVAAATATDTRRFVRADAARLLGSLHVAESMLRLQTESVRLAVENLRVFRARYAAGIATILDVLAAQTSLGQAELGVVSARFTYQSARAALEALLGRELP